MTSFKKIQILTGVLLILIGAGAHFINITADAPLYFTGAGQSLTTDPPQYTYFARNATLFEDQPKFDNDRWQSFEMSAVNKLARTMFALTGVSRSAANLTGLFLLFGGYLIFTASLRRYLRLEWLILIPVFLLFTKPLYVFGRLPYLENGMIFFIALLLFFLIRLRHKASGQILIGITLGLVAVSGKIFGIVMIVPVLLTIFIERKPNWLRSITLVTVSSVSVIAIWPIIFYSGSVNSVLGYYAAQSVDLYGFPNALKSPITFIERLISFGNDNRFYYHAPALGFTALISLAALAVRLPIAELRKNIPLLFAIVWFASGILFFMISNYRPLRYIYFLYIPLTIIVVYLLSGKLNLKGTRAGLGRLALLAFILWIFIDQIGFIFLSDGKFEKMHAIIVWYSLPVGLVLAGIEWKLKLLQRTGLRFMSRSLATLILAIFLIGDFAWSFTGWQTERAYNLKEAGQDIGEILNPGAVIAGPIGSALLYENHLNGMIYASGISDSDRDYFRKYPITHMVVDPITSGDLISKYPELEKAVICSDYWIRENKYQVVRISHLTGNKIAGRYKPSDFEIGCEYFNNRIVDSALFYFNLFYSSHPNNKSTIRQLGDLYPVSGRPKKGIEFLKRGIKLYPDDYSFYMTLGIQYYYQSLLKSDRNLRNLSEASFAIAIQKNRFLSEQIEIIKKNLSKQ